MSDIGDLRTPVLVCLPLLICIDQVHQVLWGKHYSQWYSSAHFWRRGVSGLIRQPLGEGLVAMQQSRAIQG